MDEIIKKKKKKYLYLEKFVDYAQVIENRVSSLERSNLLTNILLIGMGICLVLVAIFK